MAERATLLQTVQVGVETTSGTAVAAGKLLAATNIEPGIKITNNEFRPMGQKFTTIDALGKEWVEAKISGVMTYTDLIYLMGGGIAYAAPVQQGATTAYKWTATPSQTAVDTIKTFTIECGGAVRAHKYAYGQINNFGYTLDRDKFEVKGSMIGQRITDAITMTASPTAVGLVPILPNQVDIFLDSASAGLGTTRLLRVFSFDFDQGDRYNPVWPIDSAQTSFAATVEVQPKAKVKMLMAADTQGMAMLTNMRVGSTQFLRLQATGALIATPYTYLLAHDMCLGVAEVGTFSDKDGIYAIEWTFDVNYDSGWAKSHTLAVTNTLTAL